MNAEFVVIDLGENWIRGYGTMVVEEKSSELFKENEANNFAISKEPKMYSLESIL